jgi:hypothetical protein
MSNLGVVKFESNSRRQAWLGKPCAALNCGMRVKPLVISELVICEISLQCHPYMLVCLITLRKK